MLGYNVFIGLKSETKVEDVFALHRFEAAEGDETAMTFDCSQLPLDDAGGFLQDPEFIKEGLRFRRGVSEHISSLLLDRRAELGHPDPEGAIEIVVQMATVLLQQLALPGDFPVDVRRLRDEPIVDQATLHFISSFVL